MEIPSHPQLNPANCKSLLRYLKVLEFFKKINLKMNILARNITKYCPSISFSGIAEAFWLGMLKAYNLRQNFNTQNLRLNL